MADGHTFICGPATPGSSMDTTANVDAWTAKYATRTSLLMVHLGVGAANFVFFWVSVHKAGATVPWYRFILLINPLFLVVANFLTHHRKWQPQPARLALLPFAVGSLVVDFLCENYGAVRMRVDALTANHWLVLAELNDVSYNLFVLYAMLQRPCSRGLFMAFTLGLWAVGNAIYDSQSYVKAQAVDVIWHWCTYVMSEGALLFSCLSIVVSVERTERMRAELFASTHETQLRAQQVERERTVVASMLHEIRNPLNGTIGHLRFLLAKLDETRACSLEPASSGVASAAPSNTGRSDTLRAVIEHTQNATICTNHALEVLHILNQLEKIDSCGNLPLKLEPARLSTVLRDVERTLRPQVQPGQAPNHASSGPQMNLPQPNIPWATDP